jgi:aminoglycoside phosphotransferase family enzyme
VAALCEPSTYPGGVRRVEAVETHMSWVFLTECHAYKLKKPVRLDRLDYRTVEARLRACEMELELNRRLAASVYLAVVPLVMIGGAWRLEERGTPADWLVKMRRLPRESMLDSLIESGILSREDVERLATKLVEFYRTAERYPLAGAAYHRQITEALEAKYLTLNQPHYGLSQTDLCELVERQRQWLSGYGSILETRAGAVVDAHGDLRPEHVCLEPEPVVIDCLEFDRELRLLDPLSELAFLSLECRRLGAGWIGDELLSAYADRTGDRASVRLVPFYQSYHAVIRAAVAVWHLDDGALYRTDSWRERGSLYLRMALDVLGTT